MNNDVIELHNSSRELGKQFIDPLPTTIYVTDVEGQITYYNSAGPMAISLRENRSLNGAEAIAERPDVERRWIKVYPSALRNKGYIIGSINMLIDISKQNRTD